MLALCMFSNLINQCISIVKIRFPYTCWIAESVRQRQIQIFGRSRKQHFSASGVTTGERMYFPQRLSNLDRRTGKHMCSRSVIAPNLVAVPQNFMAAHRDLQFSVSLQLHPWVGRSGRHTAILPFAQMGCYVKFGRDASNNVSVYQRGIWSPDRSESLLLNLSIPQLGYNAKFGCFTSNGMGIRRVCQIWSLFTSIVSACYSLTEQFWTQCLGIKMFKNNYETLKCIF